MKCSLKVWSRDRRQELLEAVWHDGRSRFCRHDEGLHSAVARWSVVGLDEWTNVSSHPARRITPFNAPEFLPRLEAYLRHQTGFVTRFCREDIRVRIPSGFASVPRLLFTQIHDLWPDAIVSALDNAILVARPIAALFSVRGLREAVVYQDRTKLDVRPEEDTSMIRFEVNGDCLTFVDVRGASANRLVDDIVQGLPCAPRPSDRRYRKEEPCQQSNHP